MKKSDILFLRLVNIVKELREKCPWDKVQTIESLRILTLEEIYELSDALISEDYNNMKEELGDILLHIVFYAEICSEQNKFNINDVIESICNKLVDRHPHIYSDLKLETSEEVKKNWEKIKIKDEKKSIFNGVPSSLPSIIKSIRIQEKAKGVGFDWKKKEEVWEKVKEEERELLEEISNNTENIQRIEEEFGDLLFALVNYARHLGINPDTALEKSNIKFINRFHIMEEKIKEDNKLIYDMDLEEMDEYWIKAKNSLKK